MREFTLKDRIRETRLFSSRVFAATAVIVLLSVALFSRLIYLQVINHEHFITMADENRVNIIPLPPTRGLIYDRNGVLLAQNLPAFSLEITPEQTKDVKQTVDDLRKIILINDDDIQRFEKLRRQKSPFDSTPLLLRLSEEEVARFAVNRYRFPGVDIAARLVRNYPLGPRAVHAVGYVGRINEVELNQVDYAEYRGTNYIGKNGIEKYYEDILHGSVGVQQVEVNASGRVIRILDEQLPKPGKNLFLSIDINLQSLVEDLMQNYRGAIVAIDPPTGEVLALVSTPTYDPNPFVVGIDQATYSSLEKNIDQPLFNRALQGRYPPGSTLKPFVGLAGLENDKITPQSTTFCPGWYTIRSGDTHRYRDWKRTGHGHVNITGALAQSCDVYFYDLSLSLGIDSMHAFLKQFNFGQLTNIDITGELPALLPSPEWKRKAYKGQAWYPGETIIVGIGQGYTLTTPVQLANAVATLANRGKRVQPHVVRMLQDQDTAQAETLPVPTLEPVKLKNGENWDTVIAGMTEVVHGKQGTAKKIGIDASYIIAGKTGTAQVFGLKQDEKYNAEQLDERLHDHALFVAFAPVEKPRIALAIIVENGGSGSGAAAPLARQIMDFYLLGKKPDAVQPTQ